MKQLWKMHAAEELFKKLITGNSLILQDRAYSVEEILSLFERFDREFQPLLKYYISDVDAFLREDHYFDDNQNVSAFQHFRYMLPCYHTHEFFELACVLSGTFTNYILNHKLILKAGDILILSPNIRHAVSTFSDDGIMVNILVRTSTFEQHFMNLLPNDDLLKRYFINTLYHNPASPYLLFKTEGDEELNGYFLKIMREQRCNFRYRNTILQAYTSILLAILLRHHEKNITFVDSNHELNENTVFILQYMQKNYNTITLSSLASFFNYSERHIQRIIQDATNLSFRDNILKLRMSRAAELLTASNISVSDIASEVGYYDASSFRHVFKKYYGTTPQQYRESNTK